MGLTNGIKKITPGRLLRIVKLSHDLTKKVDRLDYVEGGDMYKNTQRVAVKMERLEIGLEKDNKNIIKEKAKAIKETLEKTQVKLDKELKEEIQ